jgi:hypothetical protein
MTTPPSPADIYPPNYASAVGMVRSLIPDVEQVDFSGEGVAEYLFSDGHLQSFLNVAGGLPGGRARILRAAAMAVRAIAVSEGLISKVIKTEDLQTDGAKLAASLLRGAEGLDKQADQAEEAEDEWAFGFQIVDFQPHPADRFPSWMRGFPQGPPVPQGSYDHGAGFGRWL